MTNRMVLAGFGGQGILFAGKVIANAGLLENRFVSWLPSYGPEMRGGTANCSVCLSDTPIGSPLILHPDSLLVMNLPSYDKFTQAVENGGSVIFDRTLIAKPALRHDIRYSAVTATEMAEAAHCNGLANMILLGRLLAETQFAKIRSVEEAIHRCISAKKQHLEDANLRALHLGMQSCEMMPAKNR